MEKSSACEAVAAAVFAFNHIHWAEEDGERQHHHRIDSKAATKIAKAVLDSATTEIPVPYLLALLAVSDFDPNAQDDSSGRGVPLEFGEGIAHIEPGDLIDDMYVITSGFLALAFARDPSKAIPYLVSVMRNNLDAAEVISTAIDLPNVQSMWRHPYCLAIALHDIGAKSVVAMLHEAQPIPAHCKVVVELERKFAEVLVLPSVFSG